MMNFNFPGIILGDKLFSIEDLRTHADFMVKQDIPDWEKSIYKFISEFLDDKDYIVQKSSGTTGKSKEYKLLKSSMIESARLTAQVLGLKVAQKALLCLSIDYIAGKMMVVRSFVAGLNLFWEKPSSMPLLSKYGKIHFCSMVPLQLFNSFSNYEFFKNIDILLVGGAEIRSELRAMLRNINNKIYESYGMAETCSHIAIRKISGDNPDTCFETLPGITVGIDNRDCLIIKAPYLEEEIGTNDVVDWIDDRHFLWKGRFDNLINTSGVKIKPEELEAEISKVLEMDFAVIGLPDKVLGQKVALVLESDTPINEEELKAVLSEILKPHHMPKDFLYVPKLPRNSAYKIERLKLQELFS